MTARYPAPGPVPPPDHTSTVAADHCDADRGGAAIIAVVLHNSETASHDPAGRGTLEWLTRTSVPPVSAHCVVTADGVRHMILAPSCVAYHLGVAEPPWTNKNTLGLELDNPSYGARPDRPRALYVPYPDAQIDTAAYVTAAWCVSYGLEPWAVLRHGDVAREFGRRTDPAALPARFWRQLAAWIAFLKALPPDELSAWIT